MEYSDFITIVLLSMKDFKRNKWDSKDNIKLLDGF